MITITLLILLISVGFFIWGKIRSDLVALCALILLILFDILTPEEALSGFSSSIVIMMVGVFIVGGAVFRTGLAKMISSKILILAGADQVKLYLLIILATSGIGAFVSNTGTVALMLPIVVSLAASAKVNPSRFLMPLAFASSMGGMLTLIGTPPNLVVNSALINAGYAGLSFFSFLPVGLVCVALGIVAMGPLSFLFLSKNPGQDDDSAGKGKSLRELAQQYQLTQNMYRLRVTSNSLFINKTLQALDLTNRYHVEVSEIRRKATERAPFKKSTHQQVAAANTVIRQADTLYVVGSFENVQRLAAENFLQISDAANGQEAAPDFSGKLRFDEIGIAEVVLMASSALINRQVKDTRFREKYTVTILSIRRKNQFIHHNVKDEVLQVGDVLLVQGEWSNIARLTREQNEWVVVGQPLAEASKITLDHKAPLAAIILLLMVLAMTSNAVPVVTAVMMAALAMILTGCFRNVEEAYNTINWESVVLIAAMLPMSLAIEKTGAAAIVSDALVSSFGARSPALLLAAIYFGTSALTLFISNTACALLFAPIALQASASMGISPYPFLFAVTVAASMCFASPFSTPPNALVMTAGRYTFMDYIKVGVPLQILYGLVMVFVLPLLFPFGAAVQ